jgi:serine protease Do
MSVYPVTQELVDRLGLSTRDGVVVSGVDQGSPADIGGVAVYDVVRSVNGVPVTGAGDFYAAVSNDADRQWALSVIRDGREIELTVVR